MIDDIDRALIDALQDGIAVTDRPFVEPARRLGLDEAELLRRLTALVERGVLSRFGPLYDAERLGGAVTLAAMHVPGDRFEAVAAQVNAHPEVAHNYAREHHLNMWFVVAADRPERIAEVLGEIAAETGLAIRDMPKLREFHLGLRLAA